MHAYLLSVLSFKRYKIDTIFNVLIAVCCLSTIVFDKLSFIVSTFKQLFYFVCKCYALNKMMCISVLHWITLFVLICYLCYLLTSDMILEMSVFVFCNQMKKISLLIL